MATQDVMIPGPVGQLEARLDFPVDASTGNSTQTQSTKNGITAILCHPHPQYGGSMHDAVLDSAADVFLEAGITCLRFNFRGVGASQHRRQTPAPEKSARLAETDDLIAVTKWLSEQRPDEKIYLAGYSFGANIVWSALAEVVCEKAIMIAPANAHMTFMQHSTAIELPILHALAGDQDEYVDVNQLQTWSGVQTHIIAGANHFFMAAHQQLKEIIRALV